MGERLRHCTFHERDPANAQMWILRACCGSAKKIW